MPQTNYHLHLKGYVGGYDFDAAYVDFVLGKHKDEQVNVLIDSLGGSVATALSIAAAFANHGNVAVHYVGMNASAATIASLGAKQITIDCNAMYLVHKCSAEFFKWNALNADQLDSLIDECKQMKNDLEKLDGGFAFRVVIHTGGVEVQHLTVQNLFRGADITNAVKQLFPVASAAVSLQPLVIHCKAFDHVLLQTFGCPTAKIRGNARFNSIPQRDNHIQIVVGHLSIDFTGAFQTNLSELPTSCFSFQFSLVIDMLNMLDHIGSRGLV